VPYYEFLREIYYYDSALFCLFHPRYSIQNTALNATAKFLRVSQLIRERQLCLE
jgi:hypothetical protein